MQVQRQEALRYETLNSPLESGWSARRPLYRFGAWEIDLARREMRLNGVPTNIGSQAFEIVETLVQSAGELIGKYDLTNCVWPGAAVEENILQAQICA